MRVGVVQVAFEIPWSRSLKEKRQCLQRMKEKLRNQFNISCAEVASHDMLNKAVMGLACVGAEAGPLRSSLQKIREAVEGDPEIVVLEYLEEIV